MGSDPPFLRIFLSAVIFGALASTVVSALLLLGRYGGQAAFTSLLFWSGYFCLPAGAVAGALGGTWLAIVASRGAGTPSLIVHGILAGVVLAAPLQLFFSAKSVAKFPFPIIVGGSVGGLYALFFSRILKKSASELKKPPD